MDQADLLAAVVAAQRDGHALRRAWLLIALGRHQEAIDAAEQAQHEFRSQPDLGQREYGGMVLWEACEAQAVAYLADGRWADAEAASRRALQDFGEETANYHLWELAVHAQGQLPPNRFWKVAKDPDRELAEFDAAQYAQRRLGVGTGLAGSVDEPVGESKQKDTATGEPGHAVVRAIDVDTFLVAAQPPRQGPPGRPAESDTLIPREPPILTSAPGRHKYPGVTRKALIADDVIRLALYQTNEGWDLEAEGTPKVPSYLGPAVAVSLLADLALAGAVRVDHDRVFATGTRYERVELATVLAHIARGWRSRSTHWWARRLARTRPEIQRLVELRRRNDVLEVDPPKHPHRPSRPTYWFIREDDPAVAAMLALLNDALRAGSADERTTALLAIMYGCGLHRAYFRDRSNAERDQRTLDLVADHWAARAIRQCLNDEAGGAP